MKANTLIYFLAAFILIAFSWWFYSLFILSNSNYISDKALMDEKYRQLRADFYHRAFKDEFKSEKGLCYMLSGKEINVDPAIAESFFSQVHPDEPIKIINNQNIDSIIRFEYMDNRFIVLKNRFKRKERMWITEGFTFFIVLILGIWYVIRSNRKVVATEKQQRNFLLSVTHEFKTPIASIKLYLQTMQKRVLTKEQTEKMIINSLKDIERLNELSENVLVATKIESSGYQYIFDNINFSELLMEEVEKFKHSREGQYTIHSEIQPDIIVRGDKFTLMLVVSNLIENACKYSELHSTINISLVKKETTKLQISDQGMGISDKEKELVFNKFYRVGNENTRRTKGTGLGLYIVKEVSKKHNARIRITDNKPKGSIFEIEFL